MTDIVSCATIRHLRGSAQKARLVVDLIRGKKVGEAQWVLSSTKKYASDHIKKLLDSAVANAIDKDPAVNPDELFVKTAFVDEGFRMMSRVEDLPPEQVHIGMRVQFRVHRPGGDDPPCPVFTPAAAP